MDERLLPPQYAASIIMFRASTAIARGDLEQAETTANRIRQLASATFDPTTHWLGPAILTIRLLQGRLPELIPLLEPAVEEPGVGDGYRSALAAAYGHTKAGVFRSMLRTPGMRREEREIEELARERLSFFGERLMGYRWDQPAYSLSYANRRRLEIARATATNPRLLLLDEPAAGMNPAETHEITELIGKLRHDGGYTILVIEHDMHVVEGISDRVIALDHGVKIAEGSFDQVATSPQVVEAYLGRRENATK